MFRRSFICGSAALSGLMIAKKSRAQSFYSGGITSLSDGRYAAFGPQRTIQPIGTYLGTYSQGFAAAGSAKTYTYPITLPVDCEDLVFKYGNWAFTTVPGTISIKSALQVGSNIYKQTFYGVQNPTLPADADIYTDPLAISLPAGTVITVRSYASGAYPVGMVCLSDASGDVTYSGSTSGAYEYGYHPVQILGSVHKPTAALVFVGDSITDGTGDNGQGWGVRTGTLMNLPTQRSAKGGISSTNWIDVTPTGGQHYRDTLAGATHACVLIGTNDIQFGTVTAAQLQGYLTSIYTELVARGLTVIGCTMLPRTQSDGATPVSGAGGAYGPGASSVRGVVNAWIRAGGAGLLAGYVPTDLAVETGQDTNLWKTPASTWTVDGIHPTSTGHQAMAAAAQIVLAPLVK